MLNAIRNTGGAGVIAIALALGPGTASTPAIADEAEAKSLFKAMSDYLAAQKTVSFDYESSLDIVAVTVGRDSPVAVTSAAWEAGPRRSRHSATIRSDLASAVSSAGGPSWPDDAP